VSAPSSPPARPVALRTLAVVALFGAYAATVALAPLEETPASAVATRPDSSPAGPRAWRAAGCHFCHSLYGLGGHTGPDLTNVISRTSADYVRAAVRSGLPGMPAYGSIEPAELDSIVAYLAEVDRTTSFPPRELTEGVFGVR